ncbi:hypothetical protein AAKU55_003132 [Oxalobacteraceae bacterium GrIS 1.11]
MTEYFYKLLSIALLAALAGAGGGWWLAARDRDHAQVALAAERTRADEFQVSIREQNNAVAALAEAKRAADARGAAAQQLAAAAGRRYDGALARLTAVKATTCADAMPAVNQLLKDMQ